MEEKIRCQSCGMPLSETFKNLGTKLDGSNDWEKKRPNLCNTSFKLC